MVRLLKHVNGKVFFTLEYNQEEDWMYANWIGYISTENVKKGAELYLEKIKENKCHYFLNDNREVLGPWDKANDWLEAIWMPKAEEIGLRYMAIVLAPGMAAALSAQDLYSRKNGFFEIKLFGEIEKAKQWLRDNH